MLESEFQINLSLVFDWIMTDWEEIYRKYIN